MVRAEGSGKNLPFSSLSDDLKKKDKNKKIRQNYLNWVLLNLSY